LSEIIKLLSSLPAKCSSLNLIHTWLLECISATISPILSHLCNLSFQHGTFPKPAKTGSSHTASQKVHIEPDTANSYRPISNLSFVFKIVECLVAKCFTGHRNMYTLFPVQQSAYRPFHSTEIRHNDVVCAVNDCHVSQLVLLDLNAAFDTLDHHIVLSARFGTSAWHCIQLVSFLSQ